jgi:two-component system chemotaxis response regulator CheY
LDNQIQILVVEDEKFMRQLVCRVLSDLGYRRVVEAEDGQQGLKILATAREGIDLIILDIEMPVVSGLEFLRLVRTNPASPNRNVPVIMLTGHSDLESLKETAKLGIHGFLAKPVSKASLEKQIKRALSSPPIDPAKIASAVR